MFEWDYVVIHKTKDIYEKTCEAPTDDYNTYIITPGGSWAAHTCWKLGQCKEG